MIERREILGPGILISLCLVYGQLFAADSITITKQAVDHAELYAGRISSDLSFHVQLFDSASADLGKPKHRDTAEVLARSAPHLLAVDIVDALREAGFNEVVLDEQPASGAAENLLLTGQFTKLDPGSQAARAWIGFGAGESKVCIEAQVSDADGKILGEFSHCRKGLGWGNSGDQMESSATRLGDDIALFLTDWAKGAYERSD